MRKKIKPKFKVGDRVKYVYSLDIISKILEGNVVAALELREPAFDDYYWYRVKWDNIDSEDINAESKLQLILNGFSKLCSNLD